MSKFSATICIVSVTVFLGMAGHAAAFTHGNIYVTRVGTGVAALSALATAVFLDEFTPAGNLVNSLALPTAPSGGNQAFTMSGTATSEGALRRSVDGRYLTLSGYAAVPGTASISSTASITVNRVIARIDAVGTVDTSTLFSGAFSATSIRGAVTVDGSGFWATGGNSGVQYIPFGTATSTQINTNPLNLRVPGVFGGQLYVTSASTGFNGVSAVGLGLPTVSGQTTTLLPGFPTAIASPYGFVAFDLNPNVAGIDTFYVADDRPPAANTINVQKWTFGGTVWTQSAKSWTYGSTAGVRGLSGYVNGSNQVVLYAVTTENPSRLVTLTDDGIAVSGTATVLATSGTNTAFRGVEVIPPPPAVILTTATTGTGSGSITGVNNPYSVGSTASITALPSAGSYFAAWSDCSTSSAATIDVTMDSNKSCTATFMLKLDQTISFGTAPTVYVGKTGTVSATATSGLSPVFSSTTTDVCTISGSTVTGVKTGTCTIAADQPGDTTRNPAPQVTQSFPVILTSPPATENVGTNMATLLLQSSATGTGYFTLLKGNGTACGTGSQVKAGKDSAGATAPYHGTLPLAANTPGRYTVRNLLQSNAYTVCFTADSPVGQNLQAVPATTNLTSIAPVALTNPDWGVVGTGGFSTGWASDTQLAFSPDGVPYVAYVDDSNGSIATVSKFDGTSWVTVGAGEISTNMARFTSLAFSPDGTPYIAYSDYVAGSGVTVKKFDGNSWILVGKAGFSNTLSNAIKLAFAPDGVPYVAFQEYAITVMRYDGSSWVTVGDPDFSAGGVNHTSLAFAPDGTPYVAYQDSSTVDGYKATVMKFDGTSWVTVGNAGFTSGQVSYTSLAVSQDGTPYLAFVHESNWYKATLMKFSDGVWSEVGGPGGFSAGLASNTSLAIAPDGTPFVAYPDNSTNRLIVMKYSNSSWIPVGYAEIFAQSNSPSLMFSLDGTPCIAFTDYANNFKATVIKLNNGSSAVITQDMNPTDLEQQVTFTVTVSPLSATGTVTFKDGTTTLCSAVPLDVNLQATCAVSTLAAGTNTVSASYSGDASFAGSVASVDHQVQGKVLNLTVAGAGGDMVSITRNPQNGHPAVICGVGTCQVAFPSNAALILSPVLDVLSLSAVWDGSCAGSTVCNVNMDTDKSITATFISAQVGNISTNVPYQTLAAAVAGARPSGDEIRMLSGLLGDFSDVTLDRSLTLRGGWLSFWGKDVKPTLLNTGLTVQSGDSRADMMVVKGKLAIQGGSLRVQEVQVQP